MIGLLRLQKSSIQRSGFTLIELLVVVAIIGILAAAGLAAYSAVLKNARDSKRKADLNIIRGALEQYFADQKYYPVSPLATSLINNGRTYLNAVPKDPINTDPYIYTHKALNPSNADCDNTTSNLCVKYCLATNLENIPSPEVSTCDAVFTDAVMGKHYNYKLTAP